MATAEVSRVTTQSASDAPAKATSVALVPVVAAPRPIAAVAQGSTQGSTRPDPSFVTHLIAMAEMSPQTRLLRRAAPEVAQAAYRSVANQNRPVTPPGVRMRLIA